MNWKHAFVLDAFGHLRWVQVLAVDDLALLAAVEDQTIVGEIIVGDVDSYGCVEFGVKVGTA